MITRHYAGLIVLAGAIMCLALAAATIDMRDAMAKCQKRSSFTTCHSALYR